MDINRQVFTFIQTVIERYINKDSKSEQAYQLFQKSNKKRGILLLNQLKLIYLIGVIREKILSLLRLKTLLINSRLKKL